MPKVDGVTLTILLPLAGAVAAFLSSLFPNGRFAGGSLSLSFLLSGGVVLSLFPVLQRGGPITRVVGGWAPSVGIQLYLDGLAWTLLLTLFVVAFLVLLYALGAGGYGAIFYAVYGIAVAGMAGVILSADLFNLFVFFEVLSLSATILIAYKRQLTGLYAAYRYLLITALSVTLYLLGLFLLYRETGELRFTAVNPAGGPGEASALTPSTLAGLLLFSGVAIRVALVPFHTWLPDAHSQAPHSVSALLSGLMIKAAFIALWRVVSIFSGDPRFMELLAVIGILSAVLGVLLALTQRDAKRLLAYHSISQMGYIAVAAGAGALGGALYHAVGHALFKSLLFLVVGYYITTLGSRDLYQMRNLPGVASRPGVGVLAPLLFLVGAGAIAGVPPFAGFASKGLIGAGLNNSFLYWGLKAVSIGTAASFIKLGWFLLPAGGWGVPVIQGRQRDQGQRGARLSIMAGMSGLALLITMIGVFPGALLSLLEKVGLSAEIEATLSASPIYSGRNIVESVATLVIGFLLFTLLRTRAGKRLTTRISDLRMGVDGSLAVMAFGLLISLGVFVL